ncbi:hypothetical protein LTR37_008283 [Vermiconidia calcicola]|uniref:Uncharacterized protein n=1 Tax=Vermiconidia calcicola TaxID=1690605 RepID=A0ACC3NCR2_9PEZI|nr:hypothetical protein LTR37_008283 [Vermiconidia calcicola]
MELHKRKKMSDYKLEDLVVIPKPSAGVVAMTDRSIAVDKRTPLVMPEKMTASVVIDKMTASVVIKKRCVFVMLLAVVVSFFAG